MNRMMLMQNRVYLLKSLKLLFLICILIIDTVIIYINLFMAGVFNRFFQRLIHIQIIDKIDVKQADRIYRHLYACQKYSVPAVIVSINSTAGCLVQAKNISSAIQQFASKKGAPIYCFAEDNCLSSANVILTSGKNSYASRLSMLGDFGYYSSTLGFKDLILNNSIGYQVIRGGENKATMNPLEDLTQKDKKWIQNTLYTNEHQLRTTIIKNRLNHFKRLGATKQIIQSQIFQKGIVRPQDAIRLGLIDGIKTADEFISEKFQNIKIKKINPPKYSLARLFDIKSIVEDL